MGHIHFTFLVLGLIGHSIAAAVARHSNCTGPPRQNVTYFSDENVRYIVETMDKWKVPGMSIAVIDGERDFSRGFGLASMNPDINVTADTLFLAGSTTKAQTAACLSHLIHSGQHPDVNWSTPISYILKDDFKLHNQNATKMVTLDDAVSHRTGLPRHDPSLQQRNATTGRPFSTKEIVRNMANLPFPGKPREKWIYGNYMFITLSYVMEKLTGKTLAQIMRETLWEPLDMKSTFFGLEEVQKNEAAYQRLANGYIWGFERNYIQVERMPLTDVSGAAAVISSVKDYAKWVRALLSQSGPLSPEVHQDIRKPRTNATVGTKATDVRQYSLAWFQQTIDDKVFYWHDGSMIGQKSLVYWFPEDNFGFVLFGNADGAEDANTRIAWRLIGTKFGWTAEETTKKSGVKDGDIGSGRTDAAKFDQASKYYFDNRTAVPVSPNVTMRDYEGKYCSNSYGNLNVTANIREDWQMEKEMLLIERPETTWHYGLKLRHVYDEHWLASAGWLDDMIPGVHHKAEFVRGLNQKASALKIDWYQGTHKDRFEGTVVFKRC